MNCVAPFGEYKSGETSHRLRCGVSLFWGEPPVVALKPTEFLRRQVDQLILTPHGQMFRASVLSLLLLCALQIIGACLVQLVAAGRIAIGNNLPGFFPVAGKCVRL